MLANFLGELFSLDPDFLIMRINGIDESVRQDILEFCNFSDLSSSQKEIIKPLASSFDKAVGHIQKILKGDLNTGDYSEWKDVAEKTDKFADVNPKAATLISAVAFAAWEGALGKSLFRQPYSGNYSNSGWSVFPLIIAKNATRGGAMLAPRQMLETAIEFIASNEMAPFDDGQLSFILKEYKKVFESIEKKYRRHVANLAWDLRESISSSNVLNFRPEVAAILWALGYVPQAHLMKNDNGVPTYRPSLNMMIFLVDRCLRVMPENPLIQCIWLEMKDRQPFNLRDHRELYAFIDLCFDKKQIHLLDAMMPIPPSRSFAKLLINYFRGVKGREYSDINSLNTSSEMLISTDPLIALQMKSLINLIDVSGEQQKNNWLNLSDLATHILEFSSKRGIFQNYGRIVDIPFYYLLNEENVESLDVIFDHIETYRVAGLWYWFMVTRPIWPIANSKAMAMLEEEDLLLNELRGARFIRYLQLLPRHYTMFGCSMDELLERELPKYAEEKRGSLLGYEPFDQDLAIKELKDVEERLLKLFNRMKAELPRYAAVRNKSQISINEFSNLLNEHRDYGK